jgi:hypothetical protein
MCDAKAREVSRVAMGDQKSGPPRRHSYIGTGCPHRPLIRFTPDPSIAGVRSGEVPSEREEVRMEELTYVRVYADETGESRFEDESVALESVDYAPPAPLLRRAAFGGALDVAFVYGTKEWGGDIPHPAPFRQLMCVLHGTFEVEASDGTTRQLTPGSVLLLEDTSGKGHATRAVTDDALVVAARLDGSG